MIEHYLIVYPDLPVYILITCKMNHVSNDDGHFCTLKRQLRQIVGGSMLDV